MNLQLSTLKNGLRVVSETMPGLLSASVGIWVLAGGRHESAAQNGIAHFLEHMAFKGTKSRSARQIAEEIEDLGGYINAYTSKEVTAYYARVLSGDVAKALEVLADILRAPVFAAKDIETERHVILQEIGQTLDTPDDIVFDWLTEAAYPGQAFGRTILGDAAHVESFARVDLARFVGQHYGPGQMILSAAGGVDHAALLAQAEALFGDMAPQSPPPLEKARFHSAETRVDKALEQAHVALAFPAPDARSKEIYAAQVYAMAMGGGMSSRLFQKLREDHGLCYTIFAQAGAYDDTGQMTIYAGTSGEELPELLRLTRDELRRAAEDGFGAAETARARAQIRAGLLMGLESPSARAERLARLVALWGRVPGVEETLAEIDAVGPEALRSFGQKMLGGGAAAALYGPLGAAPGLFDLAPDWAGPGQGAA